MKHNKKRNPALVYEALVYELTKCVASNDNQRKNRVLKVIKESFKGGTELKRELDIYRDLLDVSGMGEAEYRRLLQEARESRRELDGSRLKREKDSMVSKINKTLGQDVYSNFIKNYRPMATVYQILSERVSPKKRIGLEEKLVDMLIKEEKESELEPLDNFTFNIYVKKFNERHSGFLREQKELLSRYVMSVKDDMDFKTYLNEEVGRLKRFLKVAVAKIDDESAREQTGGVLKLMEGMGASEVTEETVETVLRVQELVKELRERFSIDEGFRDDQERMKRLSKDFGDEEAAERGYRNIERAGSVSVERELVNFLEGVGLEAWANDVDKNSRGTAASINFRDPNSYRGSQWDGILRMIGGKSAGTIRLIKFSGAHGPSDVKWFAWSHEERLTPREIPPPGVIVRSYEEALDALERHLRGY